jgi:putative hydrolase of the HAD superfamily
MTLKAVFIDAGNTLLYENPSRFEIYAQAARGRGVPVTTGRMTELMRSAHRELPREIEGAFRYSEGWFATYIRRIFQDELGLSSGDLPGLSAEIFSRFAEPGTFRTFPGTLELLDGIRRRGLAVGIVSNWSQRLPAILAGLGIDKRIDFVLASAIERVEKPDPEIFRRACARVDVAPEEALHAGDDAWKDVRGARDAGLASVRVLHAQADGNQADEKRGNGGFEKDPETGAPLVGSLFELADWIAGQGGHDRRD